MALQDGYSVGVDGHEYYYYNKRTAENWATSKTLSFNSGFSGGVRAGWTFNNKMGFDVDITYTQGVKEARKNRFN